MSNATTLIHHSFRIKNALSCNEYIICDSIYFLQTSPKNTAGGWCYAGREYLGTQLGLSRQSITKIIEKLIELGFVIKNPETKFLKTTEKWFEVYELRDGLQGVKKVDTGCKESLHDGCKESLHYNSINNNSNNNTTKEKNFSELNFKAVPYPKWTIDQFRESIREARESRNKNLKKAKFSTDMLRTFFAYWTEPDPQGVMKFAKQKTWQTAGRLAQWEGSPYNK